MNDPAPDPEVTQCLQRMAEGDTSVAEQLYDLIYEDLRKVAAGLFRAGGTNTLQPTALVNEAYLRLVRHQDASWESRRHFFDVASMAMRQLLTNHVRHRRRLKRGGDRERLALEDAASQMLRESSKEPVDLGALDEALTELEQLDERQARIVRLRFLTGLSIEETAKFLDVSPRTVRRDWQMARGWLQLSLQEKMQED